MPLTKSPRSRPDRGSTRSATATRGPTARYIEDKQIAVGTEKYPGSDLLIETPNGYLRNRVVIAGNRLYQVMIQGTKEIVTSPSADKFIASFEITK